MPAGACLRKTVTGRIQSFSPTGSGHVPTPGNGSSLIVNYRADYIFWKAA